MKEVKPSDNIRKTVSIPSELWDRIKAEADRVGMTQNGTIRSILMIYFSEMDRKERMGNDA